jgi:DNA-binding MarR family transcriptional regulator
VSENLDDVVETVFRRAPVLARLVDGAADKPTLVSDLDVSRSTVDRAVRELSVHGLVERRDGRVCVTLAGRLAHEAFADYRSRTGDVLVARSLLSHLDPRCEVDERVLAGATVMRMNPAGPGEPTNQTAEFTEDVDRITALIRGITNSEGVEAVRDAVVEDGVRYEPVYGPGIADFVREHQLEQVREMAATGRFRAFETHSVPFGLYVADRPDGHAVSIVVHDDDNDYRGSILARHADAFEWATEVYERHRRDAVEITDEFRP